ncbi:DUF6177 family protein [Streptomyces sp. NPDC050095]|uniref:DUF6177 family protein n=1 Tax=unclassified Streptomyces TaxID=2593676 RepID=UPI0034296F15
MTKDAIALTPTLPNWTTVLAGLYAGGPDLRVGTIAEGAVIQLCAADGRPLVSIEAPTLVHTRSEIDRLLGIPAPPGDGPVWWTEARASTAIAEAEHLAASFAGRVATVLDGTVWPHPTPTTDVVPLDTDITAVPVPDTGIPAVDVLTERAAVIIQDRPIVPLTTWLSDALHVAADTDRAFQIVTPPTSRLTLPLRTALRGLPNRWVIQDPELGLYDGLSGAQLHWKNGIFTPQTDDSGQAPIARPFQHVDNSGERQLLINIRTRHAPTADLQLGGAVETAFLHLTGAPPAGWSTAEPINLPWSTRQLTELARSRAPQPTLLTAVGQNNRPALATVRVLRTPTGVEEDIALTIGYASDELPVQEIGTLATELDADHGLASLLASVRTARGDLTVPPYFEPPPLPLTLTLGHVETRTINRDLAEHPPGIDPPITLGPPSEPVLHYRISDGNDPQGWETLQRLTRHLQQA